MGRFRCSLDKALSRRVRIFLLVVAGFFPTIYVLKHYDSPPHFAELIYFGAGEKTPPLPEVNALNPPRLSPGGYDAQYYAQVAIHPLLTDPHLKLAMDVPSYRARRILLPALAHVLGLGRPGLVLEIFALLNLGFWFLLLFGMVHFLKAESARDFLCIFAAVFTTGSMISVERALTDLPATTLLFFGAALGPAAATGAIALALLARETSALFLVRFAWPLPKDAKAWLILTGRTAVILAPLALWVLYVRHMFGRVTEDTHAFVWPFTGWVKYIELAWFNLRHMTVKATPWVRPLLPWNEALRHPGKEFSRCWELARPYLQDTTKPEWLTFELLAPLSLLAQVCFFAVRRSLQSPYWRMGVVFAVMMICMSTSEEEIAYCRAVLPVTLAFNVELMRLRGRAFAFFFIAGNIGLIWGLRDMLAYCFFK